MSIVNKPEQINQHRTRSSLSSVFFKKYDQEWDYENRCQACNCLYLKSETNRKVCCNGGEWLSLESYFPYLNPLPEAIKHLAVNEINRFGCCCSSSIHPRIGVDSSSSTLSSSPSMYDF